MEELLDRIDQANDCVISRDYSDLDKTLREIIVLSSGIFPRIISSYMNETMQDHINEISDWVSLFEQIMTIPDMTDGFEMFDLLNNQLYKKIYDYKELITERNIVIE